MKITVSVMAMVIGLSATVVFAEMGGGPGISAGSQPGPQPGGMIATQQSHRMMSSQMMGQEMMRQMLGMMTQMNGVMQRLSGTMENGKEISHGKMMGLSNMMNDMSVTMKQMSDQLAMGEMDPDVFNQLQARVESMTRKISKIEKASN